MPISENIGAAIEQLRSEFPALLGNDSRQFLAQLDAALARGDEDQVLELFDEEKYPALYNRLLDLLGQQRGTTKGLPGLYGRSQAPGPTTLYKCKIGPHYVHAKEVQKRNVANKALCPLHDVPMVVHRDTSKEEKK
jgi:hypothetical protein